jgi:hypothetical protein
MRHRSFLLAAALIASPMAAVSAQAAACAPGSVGTYTTPGFTCTIDGLLFSNIQVGTTATGGGILSLGNFVPFTSADGTENGLSLFFTAISDSGLGVSSTDIAWTYNVTALPGFLINDALLALAGQTTGTGRIGVSEVLSNGVTLTLDKAGSIVATFPVIAALTVLKDQFTFSGTAGFATSSILTNAFSVSAVPIPGAALLMGSVLGLAGFGAWRRRRGEAPALA